MVNGLPSHTATARADENPSSPTCAANAVSTLTVVSLHFLAEPQARDSVTLPQESSGDPGEGYSNMAALLLFVLYIGLLIRFEEKSLFVLKKKKALFKVSLVINIVEF